MAALYPSSDHRSANAAKHGRAERDRAATRILRSNLDTRAPKAGNEDDQGRDYSIDWTAAPLTDNFRDHYLYEKVASS